MAIKRYARIQDGHVFEFIETDQKITDLFHPSFLWVPAPKGVSEGDVYNPESGKFSKPAAPKPTQESDK